jgi:hypothetical protein
MPFPLFHYPAGQESPFTIFIEHHDQTRDQHWRPAAAVQFGKSLRTSGFLFALPPEDLKSFLLLLTFLTPNGDCGPSVLQLATALRLSPAKTRARLERLVAARWHGQPIVRLYRTESGLDLFRLAPGLLPLQEQGEHLPIQPRYQAAPREVIIEHSRRTYAQPRVEVERQIAEMNGWKKPGDSDSGTQTPTKHTNGLLQENDPEYAALHRELLRAGLRPEQADELLAHFDWVRIRRQLMWLPQRAVRNKVGFLIAAIKDDYAAPEFRMNSRSHNPVAVEDTPSQITPNYEEPAPAMAQEVLDVEGVEAAVQFQTADHPGAGGEPIVLTDIPTPQIADQSQVPHED